VEVNSADIPYRSAVVEFWVRYGGSGPQVVQQPSVLSEAADVHQPAMPFALHSERALPAHGGGALFGPGLLLVMVAVVGGGLALRRCRRSLRYRTAALCSVAQSVE
jgi:hypothetical protein